MKKKDDMIVLVVTLRCLLNDDAATLYMTISDKEENENEGLRFDELCFLTSYDTANKPYEAEAGQRTIENQINLEWSIFFILIKIKIIIKTNKYWSGATQAFRIWPSKVRPHNHHILNGTVLAVGNFYSYSLNSIFTPTCSKICLNQNCTSVT